MNLIISIAAARYMDIVGVFLGTLISMVSTSLWVETLMLFKYGFHESTCQFWKNNLLYSRTERMRRMISYLSSAIGRKEI